MRARTLADYDTGLTGPNAKERLTEFHWISVPQTVGFSLVLIVIWMALIADTQRRYVMSFRDALQTRRLHL